MEKMAAIDPVTLVVVQNGLQQVASEMDLTFERAAFSPVISEGFDRSDGIYSRDNGEVIAQGELGLPIFVGVMQFTTRAVIDHVKAAAEPLTAPSWPPPSSPWSTGDFAPGPRGKPPSWWVRRWGG